MDSSSTLVPALTVLYHPDLERIGERALLDPLLAGEPVGLSRQTPLFMATASPLERPLEDRRLSRTPCWLRAAVQGLVIDPSGGGTPIILDGETLSAPLVLSINDLDAGVVLELSGAVVVLVHRHLKTAEQPPPRFRLVGDSRATVDLRRSIAGVARGLRPLLLRGEIGTGKEKVADAIHRASRRGGAMVSINLATVPASLAHAELFGPKGGVVKADGGTLFLDGLGEAPRAVQDELLRWLDTGQVQLADAPRPEPVDVRLIAASDADLEASSVSGSFQSPLLHRLSDQELRLPPLRQRRDDFGIVFLEFLRHELEKVGEAERLDSEDATPWLQARLVARLAALDWPGNTRQVRNVVRQLVLDNRGQDRYHIGPEIERLLSADDPDELRADPAELARQARRAARAQKPARRDPNTIDDDELLETLCAEHWNLKATAKRLSIPRTALFGLIEKSPTARLPTDIPDDEIRGGFEDCGGDWERLVDTLGISREALERRLRDLGLLPESGEA